MGALRSAITSHDVVAERPADKEWALSGPTLIVAYRPEVNGYISVDIVTRAWPDHMGSNSEQSLFRAWALGHFGPLTFPGNLERAKLLAHWKEGARLAERHDSFVRINCSYLFGAKPNDKVFPADYEPSAELFAVTRIAADLLALPNALCYFNPAGEVLQSRQGIEELFQRHEREGLLPLELWSNTRFLELDKETPVWSLLDTVGMWQLDVPDHEACFVEAYKPGEVDYFLRNASLYVFTNGPIIRDGETMDGAGDIRWHAWSMESFFDPPREVLMQRIGASRKCATAASISSSQIRPAFWRRKPPRVFGPSAFRNAQTLSPRR